MTPSAASTQPAATAAGVPRPGSVGVDDKVKAAAEQLTKHLNNLAGEDDPQFREMIIASFLQTAPNFVAKIAQGLAENRPSKDRTRHALVEIKFATGRSQSAVRSLLRAGVRGAKRQPGRDAESRRPDRARVHDPEGGVRISYSR